MNQIISELIDFAKLAYYTSIGYSVEEYYNKDKPKPDNYHLQKALDDSSKYLLDNYK